MWLYIVGGCLVAFHLLGIITAANAIMSVRTPQGAVGWLMALLTLPYFAVPAYWVFGRNRFQGYVVKHRKGMAMIDPMAAGFIGELRAKELVATDQNGLQQLAQKLIKLPCVTGNEVELLVNAETTYASMLEGMAAAKSYILLQFYTLRNDEIGKEFFETLKRKASEGVHCHVLYDEMGSSFDKAFREKMEELGVIVRPFDTTRGSSNRFQLNFRNHRKIIVVDGHTAWVGGLNVGDEYLGRDPDIGAWRDTHLRVRGPIVQCLQVPFCEDWQWSSNQLLDHLDWTPEAACEGKGITMQCLPTGPADKLETNTLFVHELIHRAKKRLWITTPYFVPDEQFISSLQLASLRGVDVKVIIPSKSDSRMAQLASYSFLDEMENAGVEVWRYEPAFPHQKVMLIDDEAATVGTANFDNRSFRLNFEVTMLVEDKGFASQIHAMLENDLSESRQVGRQEYQKLGYWKKLAVNFSRLLAPIQ